MLEYWHSLCGNSNSTKMWGLFLEHTASEKLPGTLFEAHGLEVENHARANTLEQLFTPRVIKNLRENHNSRVLFQCATEYTRIGDEPYSTVYAWLRNRTVPLNQISVVTCSDHLRNTARATWQEVDFSVIDWWEYGPRWWHEHCEPTAPAQQRFTCLNRRPHEWRAAFAQAVCDEPAYWNNTVHTMGNRNYHHLGEPDSYHPDQFRNNGVDFLGKHMEQLAQTWWSKQLEIQLPDATSFIDTALYTASRSGSINIVTESYPAQTRHSPTEKTYRAYAVARPHITLGHHNWGQNLLERGYRLYPWDQQYDHIRDNEERFRAVVRCVLDIAQLNHKQFKRLCKQVEPIVQHNHRNWLRRTEQRNIHRRLSRHLQP